MYEVLQNYAQRQVNPLHDSPINEYLSFLNQNMNILGWLDGF